MYNRNNIDSTAKEAKYWTSTTDFFYAISEKKNLLIMFNIYLYILNVYVSIWLYNIVLNSMKQRWRKYGMEKISESLKSHPTSLQ